MPGSVIKVYNRLLVAASRAQFFVFPHALRGFQGEFEILDMDDYTRQRGSGAHMPSCSEDLALAGSTWRRAG